MQTGGSIKEMYSYRFIAGGLGDFFRDHLLTPLGIIYYLPPQIGVNIYTIYANTAIVDLADRLIRCDGSALFNDIVCECTFFSNTDWVISKIKEPDISEIADGYQSLPPVMAFRGGDVLVPFNDYIVLHTIGSREEICLTRDQYRELVLLMLDNGFHIVQVGHDKNIRPAPLCTDCKFFSSYGRCLRFQQDLCFAFRSSDLGINHPNFVSYLNQLDVFQTITVCRGASGFFGTDSAWLNYFCVFKKVPTFCIIRDVSTIFGPFSDLLTFANIRYAWKRQLFHTIVAFPTTKMSTIASILMEGFSK